MSAGLRFIRSVIESEAPKLLRKANRDWFKEEEHPAFDLATTHLKNYNALPSVTIMASEGCPLPALPAHSGGSGPMYYLDVLRRRHAYSAVNERHPQLVECMKNKDFTGLIDTLRAMTSEAVTVLDSQNYVTLGDELANVLADYYTAKFNPGLQGVPFGWATLDKVTSGAQGGDLIVVAGRPSLGKSWMLLYMAWIAHKHGKKVGLTSMEMSLLQIARRWLGMHMKINPNLIKEGELSTMAESRMIEVVQQISGGIPVHLLAGDMSKKVSGIENMLDEFDCDILFVDAAYLLSPSGQKKGYVSRWESISDVVRELKALALRVNKPIVISVQFNRNQTSNTKKELDLSDIAGSDSIPQDASIVLGLRKGPAPNQNCQRIIDVMKNREGDTPQFATSFSFSPVDFREVPLILPSSEGGAPPGESYDSNWMT